MLAALGSPASVVARNQFDYLLELDSEETVRRLSAGFFGAARIGSAWRDCHGARFHSGLRFRFPVLRPGRGRG